MPRKLQQRRMAVEKTAVALTQKLGCSPTLQQIAEETNLTEAEVSDSFELGRCGKPISLDAEHATDGNQDSFSLIDYLGSEDPGFEGLLNKIDLTYALAYLNEREKTIILLKFYSGLSQSEIAGRLGISQMHVSRLQRHAIGKLKVNLVRQ